MFRILNIFSKFRNFSTKPKKKKELERFPIEIPIGIFGLSGYAFYKNYENRFESTNMNNIRYAIDQNYIKDVTILNQNKAIFKKRDNKLMVMDIPDYKYLEDNLDLTNIEMNFKNSGDNRILFQILTSSLFLGLFYFLMKKQTGGFNNILQFSKNNKIDILDSIKTKFRDVIGQDNARNLLKEYLDILKNFQKYQDIGAFTPRGVLLSGPPGTGKTLLAKALAGESNLPFVSLSGSDLNSMFVGAGAMKVKNLFSEARKKTKDHDGCIVFIDEIDAIGQKRGVNGINVNTERENTLNQLLTEMDGFNQSDNIIILGATNRPEILDAALLRPGRFDRKITIDLPTKKERDELFNFYLKKLKFNFDNKQNLINECSKLTPGFSGADISNICNEAAIIAVRDNKLNVTEKEIKQAIDYVMLGSEKKDILSEYERKIIAYHEAGHALVSYLLDNVPNPIKVSIIPREKGALGFSQSEYTNEILISKKTIEDQICVLMAGRISEEIFLNDITTGASNDIERASNLIRKYLNLFCMDDNNKFYKIEEDSNSLRNIYGDKVKDISDTMAIEILNKFYRKTYDLIKLNKLKIEKLKDTLLDKNTIYQDDLNFLLK